MNQAGAMNQAGLRRTIDPHLDAAGAAWLDDAITRVSGSPQTIGGLFPAAGRRCGRATVGDDPVFGVTVDDIARVVLVLALPLRGEPLYAEVEQLYRYGDAAERRGVLRALTHLDERRGDDPGLGGQAIPLVRDAIRANDTRLIAAALGPYAARHLDDEMYRQGVLKCVFVGIPLAVVAGLDERADRELARMLADFAHERVAAGRDVPDDIWPVVNRHPEVLPASGLLEELESGVPARREAAVRALAARTKGA